MTQKTWLVEHIEVHKDAFEISVGSWDGCPLFACKATIFAARGRPINSATAVILRRLKYILRIGWLTTCLFVMSQMHDGSGLVTYALAFINATLIPLTDPMRLS